MTEYLALGGLAAVLADMPARAKVRFDDGAAFGSLRSSSFDAGDDL